MVKNIIFDFDGTLVDSAREIVDCLRKAYLKHGINVSISTSQIGPALPELIKEITPNLKQEEILAIIYEFRSYYDSGGYRSTKPYQGIVEFLNTLRRSGIKLFIVTNKRHLSTSHIIKNLRLGEFAEVLAVDSIPEVNAKYELVSRIIKKWKLDVNDTILVGDSVSDIEAAYKNKIKSILVTYGYGYNSAARTMANHVADSVAELYPILGLMP